jgi:hypothetical protein
MASLTAHLRRPADHGRLAFHPECPLCCRARLAGPLPPDVVVGRRTQALLAAGVLALSTATPAAALAVEPDQEQEGATAPDQAVAQAPPSAPGYDPGGDSTDVPFDAAPDARSAPQPTGDDDAAPPEQEAATDDDAPVADAGDGTGTLAPREQPAPPAQVVAPAPPATAPQPTPAGSAPAPETPTAQSPAAPPDTNGTPPRDKSKRKNPGPKDSTPSDPSPAATAPTDPSESSAPSDPAPAATAPTDPSESSAPSDPAAGGTAPTDPPESSAPSDPAPAATAPTAPPESSAPSDPTPASYATTAGPPESSAPSAMRVAEAQPPAQHSSGTASRGQAARPGDRVHVVAPGESLWSIAGDLLGDGASVARTAREVNRLWELNRAHIGTGDPDLLMAGTRLALR